MHSYVFYKEGDVIVDSNNLHVGFSDTRVWPIENIGKLEIEKQSATPPIIILIPVSLFLFVSLFSNFCKYFFRTTLLFYWRSNLLLVVLNTEKVPPC